MDMNNNNEQIVTKSEFNGYWIPRHNAKVMKAGLENNKAPFLPDANGNINSEAVFNFTTHYCLPLTRLIPVQFKKMEEGYKSNIVGTRTIIDSLNISIKENEKGVFYNFKDETGEIHTSSLFFAEQTTNPELMIKEGNENISLKGDFKDYSMVIATSEPKEYLGTYMAACRSGMKLSVEPQIAEEFKKNLMPVLENELKKSEDKDKSLPSLQELLFEADRRGSEILKVLSTEQNLQQNKENIYSVEVNAAKTKFGDIIRETFLKVSDTEPNTTPEEKQARYDKWYRSEVDEIMEEIKSGNQDVIKAVMDFNTDKNSHVNKWYTPEETFNRDVQYKLLPELYEKVQDRIIKEYEEKKIPYVVMISSESPVFPCENKVYTVKDFNELLLQADKEFHNRREYAHKKYGSADNYWDLENEGKIPEEDKGIQFGYDKTNFKFFNIPNPENPEDTFSYEPSRYDIGDGNGSIFDYVRSTCSHDVFIAALNKLENEIYFPAISDSTKKDVESIIEKQSSVLKEKLKVYYEKLDKAQNDYKELHKHWLIESSEAELVDRNLKEALGNIKFTYETSMKNVFNEVLNEFPFASGNVSNSPFLKYVANEAKKMVISELYLPSREAQKAMNNEDYKSYNSTDWQKLRKVWEQFPANVNLTEYTEKLLQEQCLEKGMSVPTEEKKNPEEVISSFIENIRKRLPNDESKKTSIENVLSAASKAIKSLPKYDKFIVNGYLNGIDLQNKEDLAKFLKKEMKPKTQKKVQKKNINLGMEM